MAHQTTRKVALPASDSTEKLECFVVMPLSDPEGYAPGHFQHVFEDIFRPACEAAGYCAVRADQVRETNLIHLDVLQRLLRTPMVLVDLSSRNPNVLFELGLRQAFDKPAVLVQEVGTPKIFDIAPLRYIEYRRARVYHEVLEDQRAITETIKATRDAYANGAGVNSIVRILSLTQPATLPDLQEAARDPVLQLIRAELSEMRLEIRRSQRLVTLRSDPMRSEAEEQVENVRLLIRDLEARMSVMRDNNLVDEQFPAQILHCGRKIARLMKQLPEHDKSMPSDLLREVRHRMMALELEYRAFLSRLGHGDGMEESAVPSVG